jgi:aspartate aminotransferase-like enzyme
MKHPFARDVLMTPGPVEECLEDRLAGLAMTRHHRTAAFQELYLRVGERVKTLVGTQGHVALLASSGSGGMEASVANFVRPGEPVVVVVAGKFGQRWAKLAEAYGLEVHLVEKEFGRAATPEELAAAVQAHGAKVAFTTLQETSTGVRHDIRGFGEALASEDCLLVVDAVSGLGAVPFAMDEWGVDVTVSGSQKGLLAPPGVGLVCWSGRAEARRSESTHPRFYFDLGSYLEKPERAPFTPATTLLAQMDHVLARIEGVGFDTVLGAVAAASRATQAGAEALGLEMLSPEAERSPGLTAIRLPENLDGSKIPASIEASTGIRVAGGQDHLKGRIIRIGHMGATTPGDLLGVFLGLEAALADLGHEFSRGAGVAAAATALAT